MSARREDRERPDDPAGSGRTGREIAEGEAAPGARRSVALLVVAAVLVVGTVGAVLVLGVERPPDLPDLADAPEPAPPAPVAWTTSGGERDCLAVAHPDGRVERPWCSRDGVAIVDWDADAGIAVRTHHATGAVVRVVDPETGEAIGRDVVDGPAAAEPPERDGPAVITDRADGELTVRLAEDGRALVTLPAPERYDVRSSSRSPDGAWVALTDTAGRLLLVAVDGPAPPRVWAEDVTGWQPVVWPDRVRP